MNQDQLTIKAQQAVQKAQEISRAMQHQEIGTAHLLKGILSADDYVLPYLFGKAGLNISVFTQALDKHLQSFPRVQGGDQYFSREAGRAFDKAASLAQEMKDEFISLEHLVAGILSSGGTVAQMMKDGGLTEKGLMSSITELRKGAHVNSQSAENTYNALGKYARNLNEQARSGKLDPVIGRDEEIRRILQILSRRTKNNPVLIGEPGVGKTAIAEGIAHRIISGDIPENLRDKQIYSLDMGALIAGAKYKGEFEERLKSVVKEVISSDGKVVLFIDEIHTLVGAGGGEGAMDAANILKPALARGELRAIGATTLKEYQKYFEKDKALERRFQIVMVDEPDAADAISILRGLKSRYETHHQVRIRDEAIVAAVELSRRYITDRFLPDKAIDLIDEAAAKLRLEINSVPEELDESDRKIRQLEIEREAIRRENDDERLAEINKELSELKEDYTRMKARWQSEKEIVEKIQQKKQEIENFRFEAERAEREGDYGRVAELRYGRIGETERELADLKSELEDMQTVSAMVNEEVDAGQIAEVVSRWTGIPVSRMLQSEREKLLNLEAELRKRVIGQDEAIAAVADAIRRSRAGLQDPKKPIGTFIFLGSTGVGKTELAKALAAFLFSDDNAIVRIDMSEYQERHTVSRLIGAPPGYVGYEESGQLTEAVRRRPYSVVLLDEIEKAHPDVFNILLQVLDEGRLTDNKGRTADFRNTIIIMTSNAGSSIINEKLNNTEDGDLDKVMAGLKEEVRQTLKTFMRPEFLNRLDEIIVFNPLGSKHIHAIVRMQLDQVAEMLKTNGITLHYTDQSVDALAVQGYDPQYGARPVKRMIQTHILNELSKMIISGCVSRDSDIRIDFRNAAYVFENMSAPS